MNPTQTVWLALLVAGGWYLYKRSQEEEELDALTGSTDFDAKPPVLSPSSKAIDRVQTSIPTALQQQFEGATWAAESYKKGFIVFVSGGTLPSELAFSVDVEKSGKIVGPIPGAAVRKAIEVETQLQEIKGLTKLGFWGE